MTNHRKSKEPPFRRRCCGCGTSLKIEHLDELDRCESCAAQLPLFPAPRGLATADELAARRRALAVGPPADPPKGSR